jgi:hypothetical protein
MQAQSERLRKQVGCQLGAVWASNAASHTTMDISGRDIEPAGSARGRRCPVRHVLSKKPSSLNRQSMFLVRGNNDKAPL